MRYRIIIPATLIAFAFALPVFAAQPGMPTSSGGAALTSGDSIADTNGTTAPSTQAPTYFGVNQTAGRAASGSSGLWWAVAIASLAIILLGWFGYRELA
jgi:hypothetical protein